MRTHGGSNGYGPMFNNPPLSSSWWGQLRPKLQLLFLALVGAIAGFGQAPFDAPVLTVGALAFTFFAGRHVAGAPAFWQGWAFGFGYFALSLFWLIEPFLVEPEKTGWMAPFALAFMAGGLALFWGLAFRIGAAFGGLALALSWALAELLRSTIFTGFPWNLLGYVWIDTPFYQLAAFIGPHAMTLLTLGVGLLIANIARLGGGIVLAICLVAPFLPNLKDTRDLTDRPIVRMIHPDVAQKDKWHRDKRDQIFQDQLDLSAALPQVDFIIWPETSVYLPLSAAEFDLAKAANGTPILVGLQSNPEGMTYHNSVSLLGGDGTVSWRYDKFRLVPFGEYIPFGDLLGKWGIRGLAAQDGAGFVPGGGPATLLVDGIGQIQPLICYEGIFPQDVATSDQRPDALVLVTNDAWFGTFQGPAQHFAQARARAIEAGVPVVRVANRGHTAMIDARGAVDARLGLSDQGALDAPLPLPLPPTLYAKTRNLVFWIMIISGLMMVLYRRRSVKTVDGESMPH